MKYKTDFNKIDPDKFNPIGGGSSLRRLLAECKRLYQEDKITDEGRVINDKNATNYDIRKFVAGILRWQQYLYGVERIVKIVYERSNSSHPNVGPYRKFDNDLWMLRNLWNMIWYNMKSHLIPQGEKHDFFHRIGWSFCVGFLREIRRKYNLETRNKEKQKGGK